MFVAREWQGNNSDLHRLARRGLSGIDHRISGKHSNFHMLVVVEVATCMEERGIEDCINEEWENRQYNGLPSAGTHPRHFVRACI